MELNCDIIIEDQIKSRIWRMVKPLLIIQLGDLLVCSMGSTLK